ncbi:arsenic resistance N-acetyltransferase ArsN2 [Paraburkholderia rhynchosiae]|uniref:Amino-acid acetyltransferase n=1 Tax=Paraburkholderia rhynchosiae TaxID=487049 RepID=A0A2N7WBR3_9BURK|nr:arsenic resistance N-acetyltransferase ArsN2 [Paraburkholderia rhynchosiae]PMS26849.1 GNAT family N-acetyltransferase [Paraburkholderia rhynchosiae]CAB3728575.1 Amino-acid acetyltransferase [Paraburkholderia rhynchosiae]
MQTRKASGTDLSDIHDLLGANGLPIVDVSVTLIEGFLVAVDSRGSVIGCAGLEPLGSSVLLRSLAVAPESRGTGIARMLVTRLEDIARSCNRETVWLLTTTAEKFFERSGYERISRNDLPCEVQSCRQFVGLCPSSAICMRKRLGAVA